MKKQILFGLLIISMGLALIQGCELKRVDPPCPIVTSLVPAGARFNDTVSIKGSNFLTGLSSVYEVKIGDKSVSVIDVPDANTIRFRVPKGIGDGPILVSTGGQACATGNPVNFFYRLTITEVKLLASGFNQPAGMDVDSISGNIIVADKNNHVIKQVTQAGQVSVIAGKIGMPGTLDNDGGLFVKFYAPDDVAVDAAGNIYVADDFNHCIRKILNNPQHSVSTVVGTIGASGDIGTTPSISKFARARGVAVNGPDNIFTIDYSTQRLSYFSFSNNSAASLVGGGASPLNLSIRVAYSERRNASFPILVADQANKRILEVNINRGTNIPIALNFQPYDLAVDDAGNIIVLNRVARRVSIIYRDNSVQDVAGFGINYDLQVPSGIALDRKNKIIYISDENLNSVILARYE